MGVVMVVDLWVWRGVTGVVFFLPRPMSEGLTGRSSTSEKRVEVECKIMRSEGVSYKQVVCKMTFSKTIVIQRCQI